MQKSKRLPTIAKVLIIDDEEDQQELLGKILIKEGFEVQLIKDFSRIISIVEEARPDLILCDIRLRKFDGREICNKLKTAASTSNIKVLLYSAYHWLAKNALEMGADGFIPKPFTISELMTIIHSTLGEKGRIKSA